MREIIINLEILCTNLLNNLINDSKRGKNMSFIVQRVFSNLINLKKILKKQRNSLKLYIYIYICWLAYIVSETG